MLHITLLDQSTINKIAAGEVIERPCAVVKELVENAIDAGANAVTVEIKDGGISFIRITDNGCGIEKEEIGTAFLRHATSKIRSVEDLLSVSSLGFRGEALASIAAVSQVELITKTKSALLGCRYVIEGNGEKSVEEIGCPDGTTFIIRNLFYNTPARRKFLKSATTEASYIYDLMERLAVSHPNVSFKLMNNNQLKLHTSGNNKLKDILYHIYGRDITSNLTEVSGAYGPMKIEGYIGKPVISRGNRNFENYFINGRYIKSPVITKAIEEAYKSFIMLHRYPFTALHFTIDQEMIDVNVHPTKMEIRFRNSEDVYNLTYNTILNSLREKELIPDVELVPTKEKKVEAKKAPEPFEIKRREAENATVIPKQHAGHTLAMHQQMPDYKQKQEEKKQIEATLQALDIVKEENSKYEAEHKDSVSTERVKMETVRTQPVSAEPVSQEQTPAAQPQPVQETPIIPQTKPEQMNLFDEKLLSKKAVKEHKIIGQVFDTYWIIEYQDKMFMIDQHAAHEKILYERNMKKLEDQMFTSQLLNPPIVLTLNPKEEAALADHMDILHTFGFEIEPFGGKEYAVRAVPADMLGIAENDILIELLDAISDDLGKEKPEIVLAKLASMSCKGAVKGNQRLSFEEAKVLIDELMELENPYNCPHGRPVIIAMSKYEIEKKFKRIV